MTNSTKLPGRPLSQEGLKTVACLSMLLDHIGAIWVLQLIYRAAATGGNTQGLLELYHLLRTVGRIAFPIYCFLLAEGAHYTRSPKRYALRLGIAAILSELPFDLALHGGPSWENQSVMVTLLLGFLALQLMKKTPKLLLKLLIGLPFALLAEWLKTDYGAAGVGVMVLFALTRNRKHREYWQFFGLWMLFSPNHLMLLNWLMGSPIMTQELACFVVIPISLYSGQKRSGSKVLQWAFYLFYPVHLTLLWLIQKAIQG